MNNLIILAPSETAIAIAYDLAIVLKMTRFRFVSKWRICYSFKV